MISKFLFGYLPLKWRRLVRASLFLGTILIILWGYFGYEYGYHVYASFENEPHPHTFEYLAWTYVSVPFLSYVVEPFVKSEK